MVQVVENSLYTTPQEKEDLLKDKEKVASAFFINFLGTLGLFAISSSRGIMKTYFPGDDKVQLVNIGDANKDTSLATKLYYDIGGLKPDTANKITRLLFKLKSRAITSKNFDEEVIRELIKEIQYLSHRPHPVILNVVKQFESGAANIKQVAKAFYQLIKSRKKDFAPISQEFYEIARQYQIYLKDIDDIGTVSSSPVETSASIKTAVPHAASGTISTEPVSKVVNQKVKADTIQTVEKLTAIKDEDFYLLLWKATSAREINKLLKERGYDTFTPELMQKACDYLLPENNGNDHHLNMVMNFMPEIEVFLKAFGQFMNKDPQQKERLVLALLYKLSLSSNATEMLKGWGLSITHIRKAFKNYNNEKLNGEDKEDLRLKCQDILVNNFQRKIASAGPSDNIDQMFNMFRKELERLTFDIGYPVTFSFMDEFPKDSILSEQEKIKYLVAAANKKREGYEEAIGKLIRILKAKGIGIIEVNDTYPKEFIVPEYSNLFQGSKECVDAWYKDVNHKNLKFGTVNFYTEVAKALKTMNLEASINHNFNLIPKNETENEIAQKIANIIVQDDGNKNKFFEILLISVYQLGFLAKPSTKSNVRNIIASVWYHLAKYYKNEIEQDKFKPELSKYDITTQAQQMLKLINNNFSKTNTQFSTEQWSAYVELMKTIFARLKKFRIALLTNAAEENVSIDEVLSYANLDWGGLVRMILDDKELYTSSSIQNILIRPEVIQYFKEEDYVKLAKDIEIIPFIEISIAHNIDTRKYLPYESIKEKTILNVIGRYPEMEFEYVKKLFDSLEETDKTEIKKKIRQKVFDGTGKSRIVDVIFIRRLEDISDNKEMTKYVNTLSKEDKLLLLRQAPNYFFKYAQSGTLNETISDIFDISDAYTLNAEWHLIMMGFKNRHSEITLDNIKKITNGFAQYDRSMKPEQRREFEHYYYSAIDLLYKKDKEAADDYFMQMPLKERRSLVNYLMDERFLRKALDDIQAENVLIKPLIPITTERLKDILKYNDIETPAVPTVEKNQKLTEVLSKNIEFPPIKDLHVSIDELTDEELERLSVEYDSFNRYAHGDIALRFIRSFNVSVPVQEEGFKNWLKKMSEEGTDPQIMKPVFHGTGSVGASMILRYGFKVIQMSDASVVGRMLGDGIYFSNVLDKVAQYIGDVGYTRALGTQGYIFEMVASLGKHPRDYRSAGTGSKEDDSSTVSPEWAVFNPNEQLRIYKAYHVELIDKNTMNKLKKKHLSTNESTIVEIKSFKQFINEGTGDTPHCITYIFMDGTIPVSDKKKVDFKDFDAKKFGKNVKLDWTGSGPSVMIYNRKESKTYVVRYTREFMEDREGEFTNYLKMLNGK